MDLVLIDVQSGYVVGEISVVDFVEVGCFDFSFEGFLVWKVLDGFYQILIVFVIFGDEGVQFRYYIERLGVIDFFLGLVGGVCEFQVKEVVIGF